MARKALVVVVVVGALALILWSGWSNYHRRQQAMSDHAAQQMTLTPEQGASTTAGEQAAPNPLQGKPAPQFTLADTQGKRVSLSDYKGKAVLVNFWATWCAPCKVEIPWFAQFEKQYGPQGFEVLGVDSDSLDPDDTKKQAEQKHDITEAAAKLGINYPVLFGGESLADKFGGIDVYPMSFYLDRSGKVVEVVAGLAPKDEIEAHIRKALASGKA